LKPEVIMSDELIAAAKDGRTEVVKALIDKGVNVNYISQHGETALTSAAREGRAEVVKALIESGANVDHASLNRSTALTWATLGGKTEVVKILIQNGANVNHVSQNGETALILAAARNHTEVVKMLLDKDVDVNHANVSGKTALIYAAAIDDAKTHEVLLQMRKHDLTRDDHVKILAKALSESLANANKTKDFTLFAELMSTQFPDGRKDCPANALEDLKEFFDQAETLFNDYCKLYLGMYKTIYDKTSSSNNGNPVSRQKFLSFLTSLSRPKSSFAQESLKKLPYDLYSDITSYISSLNNPIAIEASKVVQDIFNKNKKMQNYGVETDANKASSKLKLG